MSKGYTVVLVSRSWNGKRKLHERGYSDTRTGADQIRRQWLEKSDADYRVLGPVQLKRLQDEIKAEQYARRKKGAAKAAATRKARGPAAFILCPTCNAKSKKLRSEMGGLQTRVCKNGHYFEVDTFFGFPTDKRRVERIDRPLIAPGGYNDYIYGRFKDDPKGKKS